jgi:hypothetical protein
MYRISLAMVFGLGVVICSTVITTSGFRVGCTLPDTKSFEGSRYNSAIRDMV